jgi:hypothetical protein
MARSDPPPPVPLREGARTALAHLGLFARRMARGDLRALGATEAERSALAEAGVGTVLAQDYAAWRRALLWLGVVGLVGHLLFTLIGYETTEGAVRRGAREAAAAEFDEQYGVHPLAAANRMRHILEAESNAVRNFGQGNLETLDGLNLVLTVLIVVVAVLVLGQAARRWTDPARSARLARRAWGILVLVPLGLALLPMRHLLDWGHIADPAARAGVSKVLDVAFALAWLVMLGPKVFALFPAVVRAATAIKTLLPGSAVPGWVACGFSPFYALILLLLAITANQLGASTPLVLGSFCLAAAPFVFLRHARALTLGHTGEEAAALVRRVRIQAGALNGVGVLLLLVGLIDLEMLTFLQVLGMVFGFAGSLFLVTVAAADLTVTLLATSHERGRTEEQRALRDDLARDLEQLALERG